MDKKYAYIIKAEGKGTELKSRSIVLEMGVYKGFGYMSKERIRPLWIMVN